MRTLILSLWVFCLAPAVGVAGFAEDAAKIETLLHSPEVAAKFDPAHPGIDRLTKEAEHDGVAPFRFMNGRCTMLVELKPDAHGDYEVATIGKWLCGI